MGKEPARIARILGGYKIHLREHLYGAVCDIGQISYRRSYKVKRAAYNAVALGRCRLCRVEFVFHCFSVSSARVTTVRGGAYD